MKIRVQNKIIRSIRSIRVQRNPFNSCSKNSFSSLPVLRILREKQILNNSCQIHEHSCSKESGRNILQSICQLRRKLYFCTPIIITTSLKRAPTPCEKASVLLAWNDV